MNLREEATTWIAVDLLEWMHAKKITTISVRSAHQRLCGRNWFKSAESVRAAFEALVEAGIARKLPRAANRPGRPAENYELLPPTEGRELPTKDNSWIEDLCPDCWIKLTRLAPVAPLREQAHGGGRPW
jgi:hypothetical protein